MLHYPSQHLQKDKYFLLSKIIEIYQSGGIVGLVLLNRGVHYSITMGYNTPQKWNSEHDVLR